MSKVKVGPETGHESPEGEWRYSSTVSLTSVLDGVGWSTLRPLYPQERDPVPVVYEVGWATGSGRVRKISPPLGFDPRTVQPVASLYTD